MQSFDFHPRTRVVFGEGVFGRLGELARELSFSRTLIVADRGIVATGQVDGAATLLEAAGVAQPAKTPQMDGRSFWPLLQGRDVPWRDHILYEYHWEWNFPATPTLFAIRTDRWKYIYYHGLWDKDSFHDLQSDPLVRHNLINVPAFQEQIAKLKKQLFDELEKSGALQMPVLRPEGEPVHDRKLTR